MAVKKIRKIGDPVLREKCTDIEKIDKGVLALAEDLVDTLNDRGGVGLSAPQLGVSKNVIIINLEDKFETYINPVIKIMTEEVIEEEEGCLSIYAIQGFKVKRWQKIKVTATDLRGKKVTIDASDMMSRIFQHEIDHLEGILFIDLLDQKSRRELLAEITKTESGQ